MNKINLPIFPEFSWNDYFWSSSLDLSSWAGYQVRDGAYGEVSSDTVSDGNVRLTFAPEGRREKVPLTDEEIDLARWIIENQAEMHDAFQNALFQAYSTTIREQVLMWVEDDEIDEVIPQINSPDDLKSMVGVVSFNIHPIMNSSVPYIGVQLGCHWDEEHGLGVLMHGTTVLEIGEADTAILLWIAEKYAKKL